MASRNDIFWCRVFFKAFIKHFRKMSDEEIVKDIRQSMDDLEDLVGDTDTFGSQMVRWANGRADEPFATAARENGKKGGRPRKNKDITAGAPTREDGVDRKSVTPATISQDAAHRKAADDSKAPTSCNLAYSVKNVALDTPVTDKANDPSTEGTPIASVPSVQKEPSVRVAKSEPEVLNLAYSGEFSNVQLTQEQYNSLLQKFGNKNACDRAIDSLSSKIENGEEKPRNHYATLVKWANYRSDKAEEKEFEDSQPKMSNMEKSWIATMKKVEMM